MPKPSPKLYQISCDGKYQVIPSETDGKEWRVFIPAYVYDLWLPLLGAEAIGVYCTYSRLGSRKNVYGRTLKEWARVFRMGQDKVREINAKLEECGFIHVESPSGKQKRMHFTLKITVLDPPREVSPELIRKYAVNGDPKQYQILTPRFLKDRENGAESEAKTQIGFSSEARTHPGFGSRESQNLNGCASNLRSISNPESMKEQSLHRRRASTSAMSGGAAARPERGEDAPYVSFPAFQADLRNDRSGEQRVVETAKGYQPEAGHEEYTAFERWMLAQCPRTKSLSEKQRANFNRRVMYAPEDGDDPVESMTVNEAWDKSEDYRRFVKECILPDIQSRRLLHPTGFDRFLNSSGTWRRFHAWKEVHGEEPEYIEQQQEEQPAVDYDTWTEEQLAALWRSQGYGEDAIEEFLQLRRERLNG